MRKRYLMGLACPVPLALLQRCLDLTTEKGGQTPETLLLNAVAGKITSDTVSSFVLATECIVFLLLFLLLFGDSIAEQQRTGAVYRFSRMPSRHPWFIRQFFTLGGCAFAYCGIYIFLHTLISVLISDIDISLQTYVVSLSLWVVFSFIAWSCAAGCNLLCGRFGASVGVMLCVLLMTVLAALSTKQEIPQWIQMINPASFPEAVFTDLRTMLPKIGILCLELLAIGFPAGRYFCTKDIFAMEGDG